MAQDLRRRFFPKQGRSQLQPQFTELPLKEYDFLKVTSTASTAKYAFSERQLGTFRLPAAFLWLSEAKTQILAPQRQRSRA